MDPVEFRPFTAAERRALEGLASARSELWNRLLLALIVFMFWFGIGAAGIHCVAGEPSGRELGVVAALAGGAALVLFVHMQRKLGGALVREREAHAADLAGGRAIRETFDVVDALQIRELEDEGSSYYLALADGRVLFLSGQYLYDPVEERAFPSTRIALTRAPRSRLLLDLECLGAPLRPSAVQSHFTSEEHRSGAVPADGSLLDVDFERLRART